MTNDIWAAMSNKMFPAYKKWLEEAPLKGVARGCPESERCQVKLRAPALFPQICTTHMIPLSFEPLTNQRALFAAQIAPPLAHDLFLVSMSFVPGQRESINLITGYGTPVDCEGLLNYTVCTLVSAIGEYDLPLHGEDIILDDLKTPSLVALANNTASSYDYDKETQGYKSTLAGIVDCAIDVWHYFAAYWLQDGNIEGVSGGFAFTVYAKYLVEDYPGKCPQFRDPQQDVLQDLNKIMLHAGAVAAKEDETYLRARMDPDLRVHEKVTGYHEGNYSTFQSHYRCV